MPDFSGNGDLQLLPSLRLSHLLGFWQAPRPRRSLRGSRLCWGLQNPGSRQPRAPGDAGWSAAWALPWEGTRGNVQLGPSQSPLHQAVPRRRDLFPLHLPRLLISCEATRESSARFPTPVTIPQPCCCPRSLGSGHIGIAARPVPPRHHRRFESKASPTDCSSSPSRDAPRRVSASPGGRGGSRSPHAALRCEWLPQPRGRLSARSEERGGCQGLTAAGHRDAITPVAVHAC